MQKRISKATMIASHNGRELEMMLEGKKPMAIFSKLAGERFDIYDGQEFQKFVKSGIIIKKRFFVYNKKIEENLIYTVFFLPGNEWRFFCYKNLVKSMIDSWSTEKEAIHSLLLGYTFVEVKSYVRDYEIYISS
jgi:hypothetical protein